MSICKECGVDLGEGNDICPLCQTAGPDTPGSISPADLFRLSKKQTVRTVYEISMLLLVSGIVITFAIDAVFVRGITWSLFSTTALFFLSVVVSSLFFLNRRPYLMILSIMAASLLYLWFTDMITGNHGWFLSIAGPLTAGAAILSSAVIFTTSLSKYRGLNLIATILLACAIYMIFIEFLADLVYYGRYVPQWSVVTAASLFFIALLLIFIHYRLKRGRSLGRLFHL